MLKWQTSAKRGRRAMSDLIIQPLRSGAKSAGRACDSAPAGCTALATKVIKWRSPIMRASAYWYLCDSCAAHNAKAGWAPGCVWSVRPLNARARFNVTYEIVTPESVAHGDADERGYIVEGATFRDAVAELGATRTARVDGRNGIEADCCAPGVPRWITITNGMEFETGAYESRSLHIPDNVTPSSAVRIARYLGAYTYRMGGSNHG